MIWGVIQWPFNTAARFGNKGVWEGGGESRGAGKHGAKMTRIYNRLAEVYRTFLISPPLINFFEGDGD